MQRIYTGVMAGLGGMFVLFLLSFAVGVFMFGTAPREWPEWYSLLTSGTMGVAGPILGLVNFPID